MKIYIYLTAALTLLGCPTSVLAQESGRSTSTVSGSPWIESRAIGEGAGIKTGSVEWHPGISGEFGYDSNYLQRANSSIEENNFGPVVGSLRLRVTPQLSVRTLDRAREEGKDQRAILPRKFTFDASTALSYNEFISLNGDYSKDFSKLRNLEGGGGVVLNIMPRRVWSGQGRAGYSYIAEPSNQGGFGGQFNRHLVNGGAKVDWAPGGGSFRWSLLDYSVRGTLFSDQGFGAYDNLSQQFSTRGMWRFLPKTAILYGGNLNLIRYSDVRKNNGESMNTSLGINGLLTNRLALLVQAGWAASFYDNQNGVARNYSSVIGKAEAKWFLTSDGKLKDGAANVGASAVAAGYLRDFNDSYLGDFYRRDRLYGQFSYLIGGNVITTLETGVSFLGYPDYFVADGVTGTTGSQQEGFNETRVDIQGFAEYRPRPTIGLSLQLRYDQNISTIVDGPDFQDDLSFSRFRAMFGARWFM